MTCGKVVYHVPGNDLISGYCGLEANLYDPENEVWYHEGPCRFVPNESLVQLCKRVLIERGEVVAVEKVK